MKQVQWSCQLLREMEKIYFLSRRALYLDAKPSLHEWAAVKRWSWRREKCAGAISAEITTPSMHSSDPEAALKLHTALVHSNVVHLTWNSFSAPALFRYYGTKIYQNIWFFRSSTFWTLQQHIQVLNTSDKCIKQLLHTSKCCKSFPLHSFL